MLHRQNKNHLNSNGKSALGSLLWLLFVTGLLVSLFVFRQDINDWYRLRGYNPPAAVEQLASETTMTDYGRKVFYVNRPELLNKAEFAKSCSNSLREHTIVLGCYHGNQSGIYLLDVSDDRLQGVEQVTAVHEMLHAVYERLSESDRAHVDSLLQDYYKNHLTDERIKKTIDAYKVSEPNDVVNEMHSIFGTEIADLPQELEDHYVKYVISRKTVVQMSEKYQSEFTSRQQAVKNYDAQLVSLKAQIESSRQEITKTEAELESRRNELNSLRNSNKISAYNAGVPAYNSLVNEYNSLIQEIKSLIARHNNIVALRNAIAIEQDELVEGLKGNVHEIKE